jgi:hypothetical protein
MNNKEELQSFAEVIAFIAPVIGQVIGKSLENAGKIASVAINIIGKVMSAIKPLLNMYIAGINLIIKGYNLIPGVKDIALIPRIGEMETPAITGASGFSGTMPGGQSFTTGGGTAGTGGSSTSGNAFAGITTGGTGGGGSSATATPKILVPVFDSGRAGNYASSGFPGSDTSFDPNRVGMTSGGTTINVTVNGALDKEGTARTIVDTLNNSFYRGTGGAGNLVTA